MTVLAREVVERSNRVLAPDHPETLRAVNSLAGILYETARYREAADLYRRILETAKDSLGPAHPLTLRLAGNLGATYSQLGRYRDAESLQRQVVVERLRVLGEDHHQTGMSMHNLGLVLSRLGRVAEAETWLRRALTGRAGLAGAGHLYTKSHLADALRDQGKLAEAEAVYLETLEAQRELLDADHPDIPRTVSGLATLRYLRGELQAAEVLATQALERQLATPGDKGLEAAVTLLLLARIDLRREDFDRALERVEQATTIRRDVFPEDHPLLLEARLTRARVLLVSAKAEDGRAALDGLCASLAAGLGSDHPTVRQCAELEEQVQPTP